nr:MAG TPA: hypothetical protein [Caudoviricetes sp.]DAV00383.1 MAG TPA: hypothetical protein [Caudoviricetes sp.]DAZ80457.1 MAG TPA: hypothetical protein [Caudoviricetes sp.]
MTGYILGLERICTYQKKRRIQQWQTDGTREQLEFR